MPGLAEIRVGVIDEHEIFRRGIVACLREDEELAVVEVGPTVPRAGSVDVLVLSPQAVGRKLPCPAVVCYARAEEAERLATRDNVLAVLPRRTMMPAQLTAAVRAAAAGLRVSGHRLAGPTVSERSRAVLRLLAGGANTREISSELGFSERTIKGEIAEIQRDLGARNRAHLVAEAVRADLI